MNRKTKHFILAFFGLILLTGTIFLQREAKNEEELKNLTFGYPFSFIAQDHSSYYSFSYFPVWGQFNFKDVQLIRNFYPVNLGASFLAIFLSLQILIYFLEFLKDWIGEKFSKKSKISVE